MERSPNNRRAFERTMREPFVDFLDPEIDPRRLYYYERLMQVSLRVVTLG